MRGRRFEENDALELCRALANNTVLRELSTGSHAVSAAAAAAFAEALAANSVLESLDVGNSTFGDEVGREGATAAQEKLGTKLACLGTSLIVL